MNARPTVLLTFLAALWVLLVPPISQAAPGNLDTSFGGTGKVTTDFGTGVHYGRSVAVQSDNKIVVAGYSINNSTAQIALARYNADGTLDTGFGSGGKMTTLFGNATYSFGIALQSDGKIVAVGSGENGSTFNGFVVVRYTKDGALDTTFNLTNRSGIVTTDFGSVLFDAALGVALQGDGKIVAVGYANNGSNTDFALARYNSDGSLDTSFSNTGKVTTAIGSGDNVGNSVVVQNDGKIVVAGYCLNGSHYDFAVVRYNANGSLDTTFNGTGKVTTAISGIDDKAYNVALQSDGKILVTGWFHNGGNYDFALARYNVNGNLDTTFNGTGKVTTAIGSSHDKAYSLALQSDGKIVVGGTSFNGSNDDFALVRYNTNGSLDTSFSGTGKVTTAIGSGDDEAYSLALQGDGKIVVAGLANNGFAVVRYLGDTPGNVTGTARDGAGQPLAGALVTLKRGATIYWQGTTAANGTFQDPAASVGSYYVIVTKAGYGTSFSNLSATIGGNQTLNITLNALPAPPATQATSRTATENERKPPVPLGDDPVLKVFNGTDFVVGGTVYTDRMTIVLTHGMNSDPNEWARWLAVLIRDHHAGSQIPNIVAWDWHKLAVGYPPFELVPPVNNAATQGLELGKVLYQTLMPSYGQRLHFVGHSLGAIVNRYACDYVHHSLTGLLSGDNPPSGWQSSQTQPHVTMLDEAEIASIFSTSVLTSAASAGKVALVTTKGDLITKTVAASAAASEAAKSDWKYPIPSNAYWVDNYISAFGFQRADAVNVCLPKEAFMSGNPIRAHSYAHIWYRNTVNLTGGASIAPIGYASSYESSGLFPPTGTGRTAGSLWYENLATNDPLDLTLSADPDSYDCSLGILSTFAVVGPYAALDATETYVLNGYQAGIQWVRNGGGTVIYKSGQVTTAASEKIGLGFDAALDRGTDFLNSLNADAQSAILGVQLSAPDFSILLSNLAVPLAPGDKNTAGVAPVSQPASAWLTVNVPANAGMIAFDFTVTGNPVDDAIACAVNGQNIFTLPAKFAPDGSPVSTDMMDISAYAGQNVELFFGLVGGTSTNCQVAIDGIRFITIPPPKVGLVANGPNVAVKWPAAATGWILETSDTLAPNSWQPVPMTGVTVASGVATIAQPASGPRRFYRLRRGP